MYSGNESESSDLRERHLYLHIQSVGRLITEQTEAGVTQIICRCWSFTRMHTENDTTGIIMFLQGPCLSVYLALS